MLSSPEQSKFFPSDPEGSQLPGHVIERALANFSGLTRAHLESHMGRSFRPQPNLTSLKTKIPTPLGRGIRHVLVVTDNPVNLAQQIAVIELEENSERRDIFDPLFQLLTLTARRTIGSNAFIVVRSRWEKPLSGVDQYNQLYLTHVGISPHVWSYSAKDDLTVADDPDFDTDIQSWPDDFFVNWEMVWVDETKDDGSFKVRSLEGIRTPTLAEGSVLQIEATRDENELVLAGVINGHSFRVGGEDQHQSPIITPLNIIYAS